MIFNGNNLVFSIAGLVLSAILLLRGYLGIKARKFQKELLETKNKYEEMLKPDSDALEKLKGEQKEVLESIQKLKEDFNNTQNNLNSDIKNLEIDKQKIIDEITELNNKLSPLIELDNLDIAISNLKTKNNKLAETKRELKIEKNRLIEEIERKKNELGDFKRDERNILVLENVKDLQAALEKLQKKEDNQKKRLKKIKDYYDAVKYAIDNYFIFVPEAFNVKLNKEKDINDIVPQVTIHLHHKEVKE